MWLNIELIFFMVLSFNFMLYVLDLNFIYINNIGREFMYLNIVNIFIVMDFI